VKYDISFLDQPQHHLELPADVWEVDLAHEQYTSEDGLHEVHSTVYACSQEHALRLIADTKRLVSATMLKRKTIRLLRDYREMVEYGYPKAQVLTELHYIAQSFGHEMHPTPEA